MPADLATLAIQVDADRATAQVLQFGQASVKAAEETSILETGVERLEGAMAKIRVAFGLGLFGFEFLKETIAAQDAMAQLEAGVRSTGNAAGFTAEQLHMQAEEMQKTTAYSHEAIEKAQGVLLLFTRINGANFTQATEAAADLATRLGGDVPEAARTLGRALEDPANGLMMLRRAGIVFSDGQKQTLVDLVNTGHAAEAQAQILGLLEERLGGSAAAARGTLGGALKGLTHDFADLFEVTRDGSSVVVDVINLVDHGVQLLNEHMSALKVVAEALAVVYAGRLGSSLAAYLALQLQVVRGTIMAAAAEIKHTEALTAKAAETQLATDIEVVEAAAAAREAEIHLGCAYSLEDEAAATAELTAAKARMIAADEASIAATLALSEAQIAESVAATTAAATTTVMGVVMTATTTIARALWAAIGGPIGLVIIGVTALVYAYEKLKDAITNAHKAALAPLSNDPALEKAIVAQNAAAAAAKRKADDEADALLAAKKADAERDAQTEKLNALNAAYERSSLALKIYGIELDANVEKTKAHKGVVQAEWEEIDKSIDAMTRAQIEAAKLDFRKNADQNLRDLQASNAAMVQSAEDAGTLSDAQQAVGIATMINARSGIEAQVAYEHLNIALQTNAKIEAARVQLQKAVVGATQEEIDAANAYYDEQVKGIEAERQVRDATIDRTRAIEDLKSAMSDIGSIMDMISGKTKASFDSIAEAVKNLTTTLEALSKSGSLMDAIGALTGQGTSTPSANDIFKLPSSTMAKLGRAAGITGAGVGGAAIGYGVGQELYNMTGSSAVGAIGGAASGALAGAKLGSAFGPWGTAIGGVIGGLGGLIGGLGKSKSAIDAEARARELSQAQISASLADWRAQITGIAADQEAANAADLRMKYLQMVQTIETTEAGKKMEDQRNKDLAEAADLYKMAQDHLTDSTNKLNDAFSSMVNAVSGYRLNLQLFNASPAYGPGGTMTNPTGVPGTTSGAANGGGGRTDAPENTTPAFIVQMAVDGKVLAQSTVRYARKVAQANLGSSDKIVEAMQLI